MALVSLRECEGSAERLLFVCSYMSHREELDRKTELDRFKSSFLDNSIASKEKLHSFVTVVLFCCFTSTVNNYSHVGTVS